MEAADESPGKSFVCDVAITFETARHAEIANCSLSVDEELQPHKVTRISVVRGSTMHVHFAATEVRMLRVALSSFYDVAALAAHTIHEFG